MPNFMVERAPFFYEHEVYDKVKMDSFVTGSFKFGLCTSSIEEIENYLLII